MTANTPKPARLLDCGFCYEEQGEEVHPHPECPIGRVTQPARYRRTPAEIEAVQWTGTNTGALRAFAGGCFDTIDPEDRIEDPDQDAQLLVEDSHWVGIKPGDWVVKYEGYFVAKADATFRAVWEPAAVSVPPSAGIDRRAQLLDALDFAYCQGLGFDTPEALLDAYDVSRGVSVPPPADQTALRDRIAGTLIDWAYRSADRKYTALRRDETVRANAYSRADAVLAVLPEPTNRGAALPLAAAERKFLTFALDQAAEEMSLGDGFTAEDEAALETLRQKAAEEQPAETHSCRNCEGIDPDTCLMNPNRPKRPPMDPVHILGIDAAPEQPAERPRCPHCQLPHDLTPDSLPAAVCASTRQRIADAAQAHTLGDHSGCCRVDCDVLQAVAEQPETQEALPPPEGPEYTPCICDHIEPEHEPDAGACWSCDCETYRPTPPAPLLRSEDACPGFPKRCPNLRTVDPNPLTHLGGIRCGCADPDIR